MNYVALLRGINVGGNTRVDMKWLREACEALGWHEVRTYINSGNVVFVHDSADTLDLARALKDRIADELALTVEVIVRSADEIRAVLEATPTEWRNDATMKCDVVFVWEGISPEQELTLLNPRSGIDEVRTTTRALIWKVDRINATRSGLLKMMSMPLYRKTTVRNINTVRKLGGMLDD